MFLDEGYPQREVCGVLWAAGLAHIRIQGSYWRRGVCMRPRAIGLEVYDCWDGLYAGLAFLEGLLHSYHLPPPRHSDCPLPKIIKSKERLTVWDHLFASNHVLSLGMG